MLETCDVKSYLDGYLKWLKDMSFEKVVAPNITRLSVPFLNSHDDYTEIYIKKEGDQFYLSDNGETLSTLNMDGIDVSKRMKILKGIIINYGVSLKQEELFICANQNNLFLKKHLLFQCIGKVNDMFLLSQKNVKSLFFEEVREYFIKNNIRYVPNASYMGKSGLYAQYDFSIASSNKRPFRLVKVINQLNTQTARGVIFDWTDSDYTRKEKAQLYVINNEDEHKASDSATQALSEYKIERIPWSNKERLLDCLAG